jgi:drug/metabolite transporter (DMT)-like permease
MMRAGHRTGFLFVTGSAVAWSLGGLFTRLIHLDSWTLCAWRGIFGAVGLAAAMAVLREGDVLGSLRRMGWLGWLFVIQSGAGMIFYLSALTRTSVANVAVIYARSVVASVVALLGVAFMVGFGRRGGLSGDLLALGMTWTMASTMVAARHYRDIPILLTACISSLLSGLVCWPLGTPRAVTGHELLLLAVFGIVNFAIALPLFTFGARLLPPIETALIGAVDAPLAPLWVWLAFNETPSPSTLIGGTIVFAAVAVHLIVSEATKFREPALGSST